MKVALATIVAIAAFVGTLPANAEIIKCVDSTGKGVIQNTPCPGARMAVPSPHTKADALDDAEAAYKKGDYALVMKLLRPLAEMGDAKAQSNLGMMYANGTGVGQDYREAVKLYRLAAAQGQSEAQNSLGTMYASGQGIKQDYQEAVKLYRLAAAQGNADGQNNLGTMYASGQGVKQDYQEALKWCRLAAAQGQSEAQVNLGIAYEYGQGVTIDYEEAVKWYRLAAAQGHSEAQRLLSLLYKKVQGDTRAATSAPIGGVNLYPQAADVNTAQPGTASRSGSYLDRFAVGAVSGAVIGAILGLFILVRALIRKFKGPAKSATTLTAAAGEMPMQMSTDQQDLYPVKRAPNKDHQMNDNQKLLGIGIIAIIVAMAVYPPFQVHWLGRTRSVGYGWIFSPPFGSAATIDVAMLIAQWAIVLGIGAIAFILLRRTRKGSDSNGTTLSE